MDSSLAFAAVASLVPSIPVLLVWTVGLGLGLAQLRRRPLASRLLIAALAGMIVLRLATVPAQTLLPTLASSRGWSVVSIGQAALGIGLATSTLYALAWVLVLAAVFVREPAREVPPAGP